jgi:hypothetical protein
MASQKPVDAKLIQEIVETIYQRTVDFRMNLSSLASSYGIKRPALVGILSRYPDAQVEYQRGRDHVLDAVEEQLVMGSTNPRGGTSYSAAIFTAKALRGWQDRAKIEVAREGYQRVAEDADDDAWAPRVVEAMSAGGGSDGT